MIFYVQDDDRLIFTPKEGLRFVFLDLDLQKLDYLWRIWIMERRPISRLTWDPGELYWKVWVQDHIKYVHFFQYSVKIGRKILGAKS